MILGVKRWPYRKRKVEKNENADLFGCFDVDPDRVSEKRVRKIHLVKQCETKPSAISHASECASNSSSSSNSEANTPESFVASSTEASPSHSPISHTSCGGMMPRDYCAAPTGTNNCGINDKNSIENQKDCQSAPKKTRKSKKTNKESNSGSPTKALKMIQYTPPHEAVVQLPAPHNSPVHQLNHSPVSHLQQHLPHYHSQPIMSSYASQPIQHQHHHQVPVHYSQAQSPATLYQKQQQRSSAFTPLYHQNCNNYTPVPSSSCSFVPALPSFSSLLESIHQ